MPVAVFLCVANSARSQMAEGLARAHAPEGWTVYSAGSRPGRVHPAAIAVLREVGIDISRHQSKGVDAVPLADADVIVTLCREEECPYVAGPARREGWALPDPAGVAGSGEDLLHAFRRTRDEIRRRLPALWEPSG